MSTPALVVFLAFGDDPLTANNAANWVDVSEYVSGNDEHMIHRGRNHERDENEAGTAIIVLNNTDRRFDPTNADGPYVGNLQPMTKIRIGAEWASQLEWLFTGYVESWTPEYPGGTISTCTLECVDATKYFGMNDVHTTVNQPSEGSGSRIDYVLNSWVFWPAGERSVAAGDVYIAEMPLDDSALNIMQAVTRTERGNLYLSRHGTLTFEDRSWRDTAVSKGIWGDAADGSQRPYASVTTRYDDSDIYNRIEVTRAGGIKQTVNDVDSQTRYFIRTLTSSGLPYVDDAAALLAAQTLAYRYRDARVRLEQMTIDAGVRDTWFDVLQLELSDMITVHHSTLYDGHHSELDAHIEAISWRITKGLWLLTLQLSPHFLTGALAGTLNMADDWKVPTLLNSWANFGTAGNPPAGYRKDGEWVTLRGLVKDGATPTSVIMHLPASYRPAFNVRFTVPSGAASAQAVVAPNGDVALITGTGGSTSSVELGPIRFRVI